MMIFSVMLLVIAALLLLLVVVSLELSAARMQRDEYKVKYLKNLRTAKEENVRTAFIGTSKSLDELEREITEIEMG